MKIFYRTDREQGNIIAVVLDRDYPSWQNTINTAYEIYEVDELDSNHTLLIELSLASAVSNFYVKPSNDKLYKYVGGSWVQQTPAEYGKEKTK